MGTDYRYESDLHTLTEAEYKDEVNGWDTSEKIFGKTLVLP